MLASIENINLFEEMAKQKFSKEQILTAKIMQRLTSLISGNISEIKSSSDWQAGMAHFDLMSMKPDPEFEFNYHFKYTNFWQPKSSGINELENQVAENDKEEEMGYGFTFILQNKRGAHQPGFRYWLKDVSTPRAFIDNVNRDLIIAKIYNYYVSIPISGSNISENLAISIAYDDKDETLVFNILHGAESVAVKRSKASLFSFLNTTTGVLSFRKLLEDVVGEAISQLKLSEKTKCNFEKIAEDVRGVYFVRMDEAGKLAIQIETGSLLKEQSEIIMQRLSDSNYPNDQKLAIKLMLRLYKLFENNLGNLKAASGHEIISVTVDYLENINPDSRCPDALPSYEDVQVMTEGAPPIEPPKEIGFGFTIQKEEIHPDFGVLHIKQTYDLSINAMKSSANFLRNLNFRLIASELSVYSIITVPVIDSEISKAFLVLPFPVKAEGMVFKVGYVPYDSSKSPTEDDLYKNSPQDILVTDPASFLDMETGKFSWGKLIEYVVKLAAEKLKLPNDQKYNFDNVKKEEVKGPLFFKLGQSDKLSIYGKDGSLLIEDKVQESISNNNAIFFNQDQEVLSTSAIQNTKN